MLPTDSDVPNHAVDMDSWARSACYPRRTFYPLSDGPSMQNHRITKPYFRTCSTDKSRSLAPFYLYARSLITNQAEGTYWAPPLLFRRRPPQSNYPPYSVPNPDYGPRLELRHYQGGISRLPPQELAPLLQRLPPILHKQDQSSV